MSKLRIGIVGCGEVTQVIHLPTLAQLPGLFEVTALCDISDRVLKSVADLTAPVATYERYEDLVADSNVDVVLVANPNAYHAPVAIAALERGKHVVIEKPMAMTHSEIDDLLKAEKSSGKMVQVGYMRRYASAFTEAVNLVSELDEKIRYARVHDFIGANGLIIDDTSVVIRPDTIPEAAAAELRELSDAKVLEAIGTNDPILSRAYNVLLGLSSHDLSAMRELLGKPKRVLHASQRCKGVYISASFDYGDFVCDFSTGIDQIPRFDAFLEVYAESKIIRVDYDTPYIRNLPAKLTITERTGKAGVSQRVTIPSRLDSFVVEWKAFHHSVASGERSKANIDDAREDLEIFEGIMGFLKAAHNGA